MNIYIYDEKTKEYLGYKKADKDPEETKIKGEFVPLVPANATIIVPPEVIENQTAVFEGGEWIVKADYRKNYKKVDVNFNVSDITEIGEITDGYKVLNDLAAEIMQNPDNFKIKNGEITAKTEEEIAQTKAEKLIEQFNSEFFNTSLGYVRRKVTMKDSTIKDFLTDILPLLQAGVEIITYNSPVNSQMPTQNTGVVVTDEFINECKQQVFNDFYGVIKGFD